MDYPPSKRLKRMSHAAPCNDPFGDDDDFTQDDLEEIDIIASQAVNGELAEPGPSSKGTTMAMGSIGPRPGELKKSYSGSRQQPSGLAMSNPMRDGEIPEFPCKETFGNGHQSKTDGEHLKQLEAQQADLKKKLKEVEEEILMKNGEIRVLRDSLRVAQQEKEAQRQAQLLLEREKRDAQSEKEKELSKKVQSLLSELHFKEAEMNEMKTKLLNTERGRKAAASPVTRNRLSGPAAQLQAFITKETFGAQLPSRSTPGTTSGPGHLRDDGKPQFSSRQEVTHSDPFNTFQPSHHQGSVLLSLLLQHPLEPSSLGLGHLLCISPDALPGLLTNTCLSSGSSVGSGSSSPDPSVVPRHNKPHSQQPRFRHYQNLALSGLNMMALPSHHTALPQDLPNPNPSHSALPQDLPNPNPSHSAPALTNTTRSCPGAVHLLPLLDYHIGLFCQSLEAVALDGSGTGSGKRTPRGSSLSGSSDGSLASSVEDSLGSQEEFALAALKVLHHSVAQSSEVVNTLLALKGGAEGSTTHRPILAPLVPDTSIQPGTSRTSETPVDGTRDSLDLHPLLGKLLQLSDPSFSTSAVQREALVPGSLSTLNMLLERAQERQLSRFQCVVSSPALSRCLSLDSSYQTLFLSVSLLAGLSHSDELAFRICCHTDWCLFLKVFQYITSRPDKTVTDSHWSQLEVEVVRFLTSLFNRKASTWTVFVESSCQCHSEVVKTTVVLLHRQWLALLGRVEGGPGVEAATQSPAWCTSPGVDLLREALMLLHWLFLNNSSFSEHCLPVLHMYDQMIPAIRDTFRRIPYLSESEELALDEICRPESEDTEDVDLDAGS
ncbi:hypothetical protein J4Q44_G00077690 [Coregonus suidteri]|uniref:ATR-interacting protein n=1 Tax=Coregonus suidteri TaxID=861788 RepID=A0AAN8R2M5_9TELE